MKNYLLLAPGPVNLHPKVCSVLSEPMIHHRTPLFDQCLKRVLEKLPLFFETTQRVYVQTATGSGGMESLMVNTCNPSDEILVINSGKFGERWAEMGRSFGLKVHELKVPWGQAVAIKDVAQFLKTTKVTAVFCQACETSTGVQHPLKELGELVNQYPDTLFLVDGITAVGAYPISMDAWKIDGLVAGSQKAFMLPTGLTLFSFSAKAWKRIPHCTMPRFYFDVREEDKANQRGETWFSSNVALIRALDLVLEMIFEKGLPSHYKEIAERAQFTRFVIQKMGLRLFPEAPSDSLTAVLIPNGIDSQLVRRRLEEDFQVTIMGGQDQLKGKILRIGHMGFITRRDLIRFHLDLQELFTQMQIPFTSVPESEMQAWFQS